MKATLTALAALLVSTIPLNPASAQGPAPVMEASFGSGGPGYSAGPAASAPTGGCDSCGKPGLFSKVKPGGCETCGKGGCGKGGCGKDGCGGEGFLKKFLCHKKPSNAPTLYKAEYPLGFPMHPYVRSPRDYFMWNDP